MLIWAVMGSLEHPLSSLSIEGSVRADGESFQTSRKSKYAVVDGSSEGLGGGSGGTILLFLQTLDLGDSSVLSSVGGHGGPNGGGGGGGGRVHFHWSNIPAGDVYQPIASVKGSILTGSVLPLISSNVTYFSRFRSDSSKLNYIFFLFSTYSSSILQDIFLQV